MFNRFKRRNRENRTAITRMGRGFWPFANRNNSSSSTTRSRVVTENNSIMGDDYFTKMMGKGVRFNAGSGNNKDDLEMIKNLLLSKDFSEVEKQGIVIEAHGNIVSKESFSSRNNDEIPVFAKLESPEMLNRVKKDVLNGLDFKSEGVRKIISELSEGLPENLQKFVEEKNNSVEMNSLKKINPKAQNAQRDLMKFIDSSKGNAQIEAAKEIDLNTDAGVLFAARCAFDDNSTARIKEWGVNSIRELGFERVKKAHHDSKNASFKDLGIIFEIQDRIVKSNMGDFYKKEEKPDLLFDAVYSKLETAIATSKEYNFVNNYNEEERKALFHLDASEFDGATEEQVQDTLVKIATKWDGYKTNNYDIRRLAFKNINPEYAWKNHSDKIKAVLDDKETDDTMKAATIQAIDLNVKDGNEYAKSILKENNSEVVKNAYNAHDNFGDAYYKKLQEVSKSIKEKGVNVSEEDRQKLMTISPKDVEGVSSYVGHQQALARVAFEKNDPYREDNYNVRRLALENMDPEYAWDHYKNEIKEAITDSDTDSTMRENLKKVIDPNTKDGEEFLETIKDSKYVAGLTSEVGNQLSDLERSKVNGEKSTEENKMQKEEAEKEAQKTLRAMNNRLNN